MHVGHMIQPPCTHSFVAWLPCIHADIIGRSSTTAVAGLQLSNTPTFCSLWLSAAHPCCRLACSTITCLLSCALPCCAVLCCAVLCCAVLCCAVLCCAVLCCAVLCCAVPCRAVLCFAPAA
jgi:hypothetical protein